MGDVEYHVTVTFKNKVVEKSIIYYESLVKFRVQTIAKRFPEEEQYIIDIRKHVVTDVTMDMLSDA